MVFFRLKSFQFPLGFGQFAENRFKGPVETLEIPLVGVFFLAVLIHQLVDNVLRHFQKQVTNIISEDFPSSLVDDGTLFLHHVVVFEDVFPHVKVVALDFFLGITDGLGNEDMFDRFIFLDVHPFH